MREGVRGQNVLQCRRGELVAVRVIYKIVVDI